MQRCTVAATQVDVHHLDVEHNRETHLRLIGETAEAGCDLVVFPETSVTGKNGSPDITLFAEPHEGPIVRTIHAQARERPWFALETRRPEAYAELVALQ